MEYLRTPDDRFDALPGFPFAPHYQEVGCGDGGRLRVHYVDEGARTAAPVLMLHGEPSWAYLYRKMIPVFRDAGLRAIAPDLVGFGRSDKPARREDYSYQGHVDWMRAVVEALDLRGITLVGQDWGGLIGLRLVAEHPERREAQRELALDLFMLGSGAAWAVLAAIVIVFVLVAIAASPLRGSGYAARRRPPNA